MQQKLRMPCSKRRISVRCMPGERLRARILIFEALQTDLTFLKI